jgi:CheY-like chemotaxis protein
MDIHMPEMDGIEATKTIIEKKAQHAPVIIALTASVISHEIDSYMKAGMKDVLPKPLNVDDLKAVLMKWSRQVQGLA